jgi:hypothetical protein
MVSFKVMKSFAWVREEIIENVQSLLKARIEL